MSYMYLKPKNMTGNLKLANSGSRARCDLVHIADRKLVRLDIK